MPISSEAFDDLIDRTTCPNGNHDRETTVIVHSPGFFDEGTPSFGVGFSTLACAKWCADDTVQLVTARYGGAEVRPLRQ